MRTRNIICGCYYLYQLRRYQPTCLESRCRCQDCLMRHLPLRELFPRYSGSRAQTRSISHISDARDVDHNVRVVAPLCMSCRRQANYLCFSKYGLRSLDDVQQGQRPHAQYGYFHILKPPWKALRVVFSPSTTCRM